VVSRGGRGHIVAKARATRATVGAAAVDVGLIHILHPVFAVGRDAHVRDGPEAELGAIVSSTHEANFTLVVPVAVSFAAGAGERGIDAVVGVSVHAPVALDPGLDDAAEFVIPFPLQTAGGEHQDGAQGRKENSQR
jgi:hypothetical protein